MKRLILIGLMAFVAMNGFAQTKGYLCVKDSVDLFTGPGTSFPFVSDEGAKIQLYKGTVSVDLKKKENGFYFVRYLYPTVGTFEGWVSADELIPVKICKKCRGWGEVLKHEGLENCPKCNGHGFKM